MEKNWPKVSDDPAVQQFYENCRAKGESHKMAEMCAFRAFPGTRGTERSFLEGRHDTQFHKDAEFERHARQKAEKAGVSTAGKFYEPQVAEEVGDPKAWFSDSSELKKRCEQIGATARGAFTVKQPVRGPAQRTKLAPDLVEHYVNQELSKNPSLKKKKRQELREKVIAERGPKH